MADYFRPAAVLIASALLSLSFGVLADATRGPQLSAPSPTAAPVEPHQFFGVTPVPPPMPKDPVGKRTGSLVGKVGGSLAPGKLAGGPVGKEGSR